MYNIDKFVAFKDLQIFFNFEAWLIWKCIYRIHICMQCIYIYMEVHIFVCENWKFCIYHSEKYQDLGESKLLNSMWMETGQIVQPMEACLACG